MIKSMTGFGKSICELQSKRVIIEIKSLNSKQLDINARIPNLYREKDLAIRSAISQRLQRGKIDVTFYVESMVPDKIPQVNEEVIKAYHSQLISIATKLEIAENTDFLNIIMPLPDTMKTTHAELNDEEWTSVASSLNEAISHLDSFRTQEGASMLRDVQARSENIKTLLEKITPFEKQRTEKIRNRIRENLSEYEGNSAVDENRFEQELIYYLEKLDISEEKVRLSNHIQYFNETLKEEGSVGKKLGFITQEMGREINTLGSKANDSDIQHIVVKMKDDLEKIKEQILNIL
ncbi:MAG: YicC/YloC family endoribonuclease [Bacteroidota bacterium]